MNALGSLGIPFLCLVDFEMEKPVIFRLDRIESEKILYNIKGCTNSDTLAPDGGEPIGLEQSPISFEDYKRKYDKVLSHLTYGDSYLTNLTIKTKLNTRASLKEIFFRSDAKYRIWYDDQFTVFSPETFVRIGDGKIFTYPMKGTIDAAVPNAVEKILKDPKEMAEHVTIVDLLRNDLSEVSQNVRVTRFRYVEEIRTMQKNLLQVSSEIQGDLLPGYEKRLGDILLKLLPAGSVSGAPKSKTLEIIRLAENEKRGYYAGIVGLFDGHFFDSGVMIRFVENDKGVLYYRSGGGITVQSTAETEYAEAIDKIYVPVN